MDKDKRITTIVLDREADRKSKFIAEFTGKTLSAIYREALDVYFDEFVRENLWSEINDYLNAVYRKYKIEKQYDVYDALADGRFGEVAVIIAYTIKQIPEEQDAEGLIQEGIKFAERALGLHYLLEMGILSK